MDAICRPRTEGEEPIDCHHKAADARVSLTPKPL